jgi:hypothetical protein
MVLRACSTLFGRLGAFLDILLRLAFTYALIEDDSYPQQKLTIGNFLFSAWALTADSGTYTSGRITLTPDLLISMLG